MNIQELESQDSEEYQVRQAFSLTKHWSIHFIKLNFSEVLNYIKASGKLFSMCFDEGSRIVFQFFGI